MNKETSILLRVMQEAGNAVARLQKTGFTVQQKGEHDILTEADLLANQILQTQLLNAFPADGWLSEETADSKDRLTKKRIWVVDPIDGTREFAQGLPEYAISVALIESGEPILSAVYNPVTNELFHAIKNQGAWLNEQKINCATHSSEQLHLLASRSEYKRGEWQAYEHHKIDQIGSIAYKLALIAAGKADATFSLGPKSEWDIAAGVLLVTEAGGFATDKRQKTFSFNQQNVLVNGIIAVSKASSEALYKLLK